MADVKVHEEATNVTDPDTLTELERMYLVQDPTGTPAAAQVATGVLKKRIRADKFNTASSSGGFSVPIDLGRKEGLILTLTGNVTTFALPTNGPSGTWQETIHTLRVVASGATRTIATGAFTSFDLGSSVVPASGYSIVDGAYKDFMLRRVHDGTTATWFVDLLIPGTDIANIPAGNIAATTVQAAINELDTEKQPLDATLTALAGLDTVVGVVFQSGTDTFTKYSGSQIKQYAEGGSSSNVDLSTNTTLTKASHQGKRLNCMAAINLTVDNSTDFDAWAECDIYAGGGIVTVVATATVRRAGNDPLTIPQYGRAVLMRNSTTDEYVLSGRLA